ncbi:UNVERIFIED_CONTAM: Laccase-10 [Sesamum calycinum]|uniref:Laccase-10 n=1 Tax=Sesamum calycinum TaxID=2727403 RepID=A0AAW2MYI1_9LAMI
MSSTMCPSTGMESDNSEQGGQMDQHISRNALSSQGKAMCTISLSQANGARSSGTHILWLRATLHGALVILPKLGVPYPFPKPHHERVIVLGEWWKSDTEAVINEALKSGLAPNVSDAHTINGHRGLFQIVLPQMASYWTLNPAKPTCSG